jgi:ABC-type glycerol-3-phosphate transport system substrate-binding protein
MILSLLVIISLIGNNFSFVSWGAEINTGETKGVPLKDKYSDFNGKQVDGNFVNIDKIPNYSTYLDEIVNNKSSIPNDIEIPLETIRDQNHKGVVISDYEGRNSFLWNHELKYIEFDVNMVNDGVFLLELDYYLITGSSVAGKRTVYLDGVYPFIEANDLVFYRYFKDKNEPVINSLGNETRPSQIEVPGYRTQKFIDTSGLVLEPFEFYLEKGDHTIRLAYTQGDMAVAGIRLRPKNEVPTYAEIKSEYINNGYQPATTTVDLQAELTAIEKNDPTLRRENDGDPLVIPHSATERLLNVMGAYRWRTGNQKITWEIDVPNDGLYKIGLRVKQQWQDGVPSYRQIEIDGKVPFEELLNYKFDYSTNWNTKELSSNSGDPYEFYLTKGKHTLSMSVKFGPMTPIIESINSDIEILSSLLLNITLIAGNNPDPNYDYGFFNKIPNMKTNLDYLVESMQWKYDELKKMSDKLPAMANNFLTIKVQLEGLIKNPFSIAKKVGDLQGSQESLSNWFLELQKSPLVIDYFKLGPLAEKWKNKQSNVFQRVGATFKNFISSFSKDYDNVGSTLDGEVEVTNTITVWIARGTEWAEVIKEMADEDFTPKTGIAINVNVVPAGQLGAGSANALMLSVVSGKAPDVALGVDVTSPVEFAIRDAVYDLSKFEDFDKVKERFVDATLTPYEYQNGIYAIPETMDFNVMFYRKDILNQFNIQLPDTREQLYNYVMPALYQNGLQFYFGRDFTQFLFQNGGEFYTEDGLKSALDTPEAYRAFKEYTELFTNYGVPEVANFYQYMRNGVMPLGIGNFGLYMQLSVAAPELAGKWGIAPLPGVKLEDGTIDRTAGAITMQGDVIMKQSKDPEDAWEFLKWWSSTDVQLNFANEVEALMGAEARWNTANKEAFLSLAWNDEDIRVIEEQWKWAQETPVVLGGYFTARHLTNAWTTVVVSGGDVRDALEQAVKDINRELRMKQEEYGVIKKD